MPSIGISLPDHIDVLTRIQAAKDLAPEELDRVLVETSAVIEVSLKTDVRTRTHGTGLTAASIETRKEGTLEYGVGSYTRGNILKFLDRGTGVYGAKGSPFMVTPQAKQALKFWVHETGDEVYASYCVVMGIIPFQFMDRAVSVNKEAIDELMNKEVKL